MVIKQFFLLKKTTLQLTDNCIKVSLIVNCEILLLLFPAHRDYKLPNFIRYSGAISYQKEILGFRYFEGLYHFETLGVSLSMKLLCLTLRTLTPTIVGCTHDALTQCWFNVGPASQKMAQDWSDIGSVYYADWVSIVCFMF